MNRPVALLATIALVTLVACERDPVDDEIVGTPNGSPAGSQVPVTLTDFAIEMPVELQEGVTTFVVTNDGEQDHGFVISGEGIHAEVSEEIPPGGSRTVTIALNLGIYDVWCPVGDHEQQGMHLSVQVTEDPTQP